MRKKKKGCSILKKQPEVTRMSYNNLWLIDEK